MFRTAALVFLLAACGSDHPKSWKDQPLETVTGAVDGHAYSIDLPKGVQKSKYSEEWQWHDAGYVFPPSVSLYWHAKKQTLDEALAGDIDKTDAIEKTPRADGFTFVKPVPDKKHPTYAITSVTYAGDAAIECHALLWDLHTDDAGVKAEIPLVEKMCASLKVK